MDEQEIREEGATGEDEIEETEEETETEEDGEIGETGEEGTEETEEETETEEDGEIGETGEEGTEEEIEGEPIEVETAKYRITGLVDIFDEQRNITGQFLVGSVQELPVEYGTKMVAEGQAEAVGDEE